MRPKRVRLYVLFKNKSLLKKKNRNLGENGLHFLDMTEYFIWKKKYILKK